MEISVNLPYAFNGFSPTPQDECILIALLTPIKKTASKYLQSSPKVKTYHVGGTHGRIIQIDLKKVFYAGSSSVDDAIALRSLLKGLVSANLEYMKTLTFKPLYDSGIVYKRTKIWDSILGLYRRGFGDCKSLSSVRIGELCRQSIPSNAVFRWKPRENGVKDFHILISSDLGYEDPSKALGMGLQDSFI